MEGVGAGAGGGSQDGGESRRRVNWEGTRNYVDVGGDGEANGAVEDAAARRPWDAPPKWGGGGLYS